MSTPTANSRTAYISTAHRGLSYRVRSDGRKTFYGYVPTVGRVKLQSDSLRDAKAELGELLGKASKGQRAVTRSPRFREVAEEWYASTEGKLRRHTRREHRRVLDVELLPKLGHLKLSEIDYPLLLKQIERWAKRGLSRSSVENYLKPVRGVFRFAMKRGLVQANPCSLIDANDLPRDEGDEDERGAYEWSEEEIEGLLAASRKLAAKKTAKQDYTALLTVAVGTGLRLGELTGLQWDGVDLEGAVLHVRHQLDRSGQLAPTKTKKGRRRVPLTTDVVSVLREHRRQLLSEGLYRSDGFVFVTKAGGPLPHRSVQRWAFAQARDEAKLPKHVTFHDLRHAFASRAAHRGVPVNVLSEVMGHSNVGVTQRVYLHLFGRDAAEQAFRQAMGG
jgi:integrase